MRIEKTMDPQCNLTPANADRSPERENENSSSGCSNTTGKKQSPPAVSREIVTPRDLLSEGWVAETNGWQAANKRILTARRMIALADFSAGDPLRWRTIRARFFFEELGVNELAKMLGISRRTVSRHLQPVHISEEIYDGLVPIHRDFSLKKRSSSEDRE